MDPDPVGSIPMDSIFPYHGRYQNRSKNTRSDPSWTDIFQNEFKLGILWFKAKTVRSDSEPVKTVSGNFPFS